MKKILLLLLLTPTLTNAGCTPAPDNAAIHCNSYFTDNTNIGDWYLPALGEIYHYLYNNYTSIQSSWNKLGTTFSKSYFVSSTENGRTTNWSLHFNTGGAGTVYKNYKYYVSCFRAIN